MTLASEGDILTVPLNSSQRQQCPFPVQSEGDITQLLFDVTHDVTLGCGCEGVATLCQNLFGDPETKQTRSEVDRVQFLPC